MLSCRYIFKHQHLSDSAVAEQRQLFSFDTAHNGELLARNLDLLLALREEDSACASRNWNDGQSACRDGICHEALNYIVLI